MLSLARLYSLVYLVGVDSRFDEFPGEYILVYVSSAGLDSPKRVFESCSIESIKLKAHESARPIFLIDEDDVDVENTLSLTLRISDLHDINIKTITGKDIEFSIEEERKMWPNKKQDSTKSADLDDEEVVLDNARQRFIDVVCGQWHEDAELRFLVRENVKMDSETANNVLELSVIAPDVNDLVQLEAVVYNPDFKLPREIDDMIKSTLGGLRSRKLPKRITEGSSVVYIMQDSQGEKSVSVFKPSDEQECGENCPFETVSGRCGSGIQPGERAIREVAAYLLDHPKKGHRSVCSDVIGSAGVPPTVMVRCLHYGFKSKGVMVWKTGSLQMFKQNTRSNKEVDELLYELDEIQRISVLDIRLANLDRHGDNILSWRDDDTRRFHLIPIDHGFCFPDSLDVECLFEWIKWVKAREKYSSEIKEYVENLDPDKDIEYLKSYGWDMGPKSALTFKICTKLLQLGVEKGLSGFHIGTTMLKPEQYAFLKVYQEKHYALDDMVREAKQISGQDASEDDFLRCLSSVMDAQLGEMATNR